jgi:hypothetical protein
VLSSSEINCRTHYSKLLTLLNLLSSREKERALQGSKMKEASPVRGSVSCKELSTSG